MKISCSSFVLPKCGEEEENCQDSATSVTLDPILGLEVPPVNCFAVADGVTESFLPRLWARCLTSQFVSRPDEAFDRWDEWLKTCQNLWHTEAETAANSPTASDYTVNKFHERRNAASTFVGLQFRPLADSEVIFWRALVVGDSCLFHLPAEGKAVSYLLESSSDFDNNTCALTSYPVKRPDRPQLIQGKASEGDVFFLATDAFSKWLLAQQEKGKPIWGSLLRLDSLSDFKQLVETGRKEQLDNDDVALVVVQLLPDSTESQTASVRDFTEIKSEPEKRLFSQTYLIFLALVIIINIGFYLVLLKTGDMALPTNPSVDSISTK